MLPVKRILCPTDFSEPSLEAVKAAAELAEHFSSQICLLYVVPTTPLPTSEPAYDFELPEYEKIRHDRPAAFVFGSVAEKVVRLAPCAVLTLRMRNQNQ
jgi:nucleotide-binding universal stress UspA family protein